MAIRHPRRQDRCRRHPSRDDRAPCRRDDPPGAWPCARSIRPRHWYRDLHRRVGEEWLWFSRARMNDAELAAIIHAPGVEVYALVVDGRDEGLLELDFREAGQCELVYFGVTAKLIGSGAARFMMNRALELAWSRDLSRVWVHTCTSTIHRPLRSISARLPSVPPPDRGRRRPAPRWNGAADGGEACADHRIVRSCLPTVIARSPCDEAIQPQKRSPDGAQPNPGRYPRIRLRSMGATCSKHVLLHPCQRKPPLHRVETRQPRLLRPTGKPRPLPHFAIGEHGQ